MDRKQEPIFKRSLFSWVFSGNLKLQLLLLLTVAVAVIARVVPLEMQKRIVDEAIASRRIDLLATYSAIYLAAFVTASGLKYFINLLQTVIGQNSLADMRRQLYDHILRLPQGFFRRTQSGLIVSSLVTELATAGDFVGMALAIPVANVLTLAAFAVYLFWLNPLLAAVSFSIYPLVLFLVPKLQKRVNHYNRKRVDATRSFSGRIGESVDGIHEIKANAAFGIENRNLGKRIERLRNIRIKWNLYRFAVKVVNNLLTNFSRFLIFSLGGYLALKGRLELGALVAFLSAQEKIYLPWKELIRFYQAYQTAAVTYKRTMEYYSVAPETLPEIGQSEIVRLEGGMDVEDLSFTTDDGKTLLKGVSFSLKPGQHMALVGGSGSGKSTLVHCLMGLYPHFDGRYEVDGRSLTDLGGRNLSANAGFVFQSPAIFSGTIAENLLYACRAVIGSTAIAPEDDSAEKALPDLNQRIEALQQTGLFMDVLGFGLAAGLDPETHQHLHKAVLDVRAEYLRQCAEERRQDIEIYDKDRFLQHSSVAQNLLFGSVRDSRFSKKALPGNDLFNRFLRQSELLTPLIKLGARVGTRMMEIVQKQSMPSRAMPLSREEMTDLGRVMVKDPIGPPENLDADTRRKFLGLALRYIPAEHRLIDLPEELIDQLVTGRHRLMAILRKEAPDAVSFFRKDAYIPEISIQENIVFGRIISESVQVKEQINRQINRLLVEEQLLECIVGIGMDFQVGRGGENLSGGQRQKLALARAFLKKPSMLFLDEATASLDNQSQDRIQQVLESRWKGRNTVVAVVHRLDIINNYDTIAVMDSGRIEEMGTYDELIKKEGLLYQLVHNTS